jgi:hypothetical protein
VAINHGPAADAGVYFLAFIIPSLNTCGHLVVVIRKLLLSVRRCVQFVVAIENSGE